jgi:adenylosuccinate synthase
MILENYADFVIGLQYGDEGKGKIAASLSGQLDYELVARYNGGPNAGHSVKVPGVEYTLKLHQLPSGVAFRKKSHIGAGCVIDLDKLYEEADDFSSIMKFHPFGYLTIDPKAIVINDTHVLEDKNLHAIKQGSTSSGIAPAYSDFYNRTATLAEDKGFQYYKNNLVQPIKSAKSILFEGAQGYYLNPYQGEYPYTTSSSSHPGSAMSSFGIPVSKARNIIGVAKCYETRSGIDPNFCKVMDADFNYIDTPNCNFSLESIYEAIAKTGNEYGVTTGRKRHVRFLDVARLINSINKTGTNILVLQKWDILEEVSYFYNNAFSYYYNGNLYTVTSSENMISRVMSLLLDNCPNLTKVEIEADPVCSIDWQEVFND